MKDEEVTAHASPLLKATAAAGRAVRILGLFILIGAGAACGSDGGVSIADASQPAADASSDDAQRVDSPAEGSDASQGADASMSSDGSTADAGDGGADADLAVDGGVVDASREAGVATFSEVYTSIVTPVCLPCHAPGPGEGFNIGKLDMGEQSAAYLNLVGPSGNGVTASGVGAGSSGVLCQSTNALLVSPGSSAISLLWEKVNSKLRGTIPPCGSPMPLDGGALAQSQVDMIAAWINQGALDN